MSYLREIMQRLNATRADAAAGAPAPDPPGPLQEAHLADYGERLAACSPPMLQYEWAWLEEHIEGLELCGSRPEMAAAAGGAAHVQRLLAESLRFRQLLEGEMGRRGVRPALHRHTLVPTEHSWELTNPAIRAQWGITADPAD
ncbi:MAG: hypothetical protein VKI81_07915 [Synechococcaceae cyanobacterium]|nr:hypothetical protein [Synechococcaceae cyanobacterium]